MLASFDPAVEKNHLLFAKQRFANNKKSISTDFSTMDWLVKAI